MTQVAFNENCFNLWRDGLRKTGQYTDSMIEEMIERYMVIVEDSIKEENLIGKSETVIEIDPRKVEKVGLPTREEGFDGGRSPLFLFIKYSVYIGGINVRWAAKAKTIKGSSGNIGLLDGLTKPESYRTFGIPKRYSRDSGREHRREDLRKRLRRDEEPREMYPEPRTKNPRLESKISELESKISELKKKISKLDSENSDLKAKNATAFREGATLVSSLSSSQYTFPGYGPPLPPATAYTTGGEQYVPYGSLRIMPQSSHPPSYGV